LILRETAGLILVGVRQIPDSVEPSGPGDGTKEVLGLWIAQSEGAKFWLGLMNELKNRGLNDLLIAVFDGLKGFPEAISAVYPDCEIQTCIVHLIRTSLSFCSWKERKPVTTELKGIYSAETAELAAKRLEDFERGALGKKIPANVQCWRRGVAASHSFFRLSEGNPKNHLHHQRHR
jgi:putative transposase